MKLSDEDKPYVSLGLNIVQCAVDDWMKLCKNKNPNGGEIAQDLRKGKIQQLRKFFKSEWCGTLLGCTDIDPAKMLKILEKEWACAVGR